MTKSVYSELIQADAYSETPHALLHQLASEGKPVWVDDPSMPEGAVWIIGDRDLIDFISQRPGQFSNYENTAFYNNLEPERLELLRHMLINMDPPDHIKYRKLVSSVFKPTAINALEPRLRQLAQAIVRRVAPLGRCDFVSDVAAELPMHAICEIVGVPIADRSQIYELSNTALAVKDPELSPTGAEAGAAMDALFAYGLALGERLKHEGNDSVLAAQLLLANVDGEYLNEAEFVTFFFLLLTAGIETTRSALCNGMLQLIRHPQQRQYLIDNPAHICAAVEEILRYDAPVIRMQRTAMSNTELGGVAIAKGDRLLLMYNAANMGESYFSTPRVFDVHRGIESNLSRQHRSFGFGQHFCLGAHLARLELRIMFEELLPALLNPRLEGPLERFQSADVTAAKSMPICFDPQ